MEPQEHKKHTTNYNKGEEKKQELRSHQAHQRCRHVAGIKKGGSTQRRKQLKQTQPNSQNPKEGETEEQEREQATEL